MPQQILKIATRSSPLAMWQAEHVRTLITEADADIAVEIVKVTTKGDTNQTDPLRQFGGTGVFTKEVQRSVLNGEADLAVHSLKDLPTQEHSGLQLAGIPARADRFDTLLLPNKQKLNSLDELPPGARIGTGSPRRQAQLKFHSPGLEMLEIRGNLQTRLRRLDEGEYDAIVLAAAGLKRLKIEDRIGLRLEPPNMFPAVGQGALGIECRPDDELALKALNALCDPKIIAETTAERALLAELRAGCHAPLGVVTTWDDHETLRLTAVLLNAEGTERWEANSADKTTNAEQLGVEVAEQLRQQGGRLDS